MPGTAATIASAQRRVMATAAIHHACNDASVVILPSVFPLLHDEGTLIRSYTDIGTMILIGLVTAIVFQAFLGYAARHRHARRWLALDASIVGLSLLFMPRIDSWGALLACFIGVRLGTAIYHPVGISWVSQTFHGPRLDRAMGVQSAFGNVGVLVAFSTTGLLADGFGWRAPILAWAVMNFLVVGAGLLVSRGTADAIEEPPVRETASWLEAARGVVRFVPFMLLGGLAWGVTLNYAPSLLNHRLGVSMSLTGLILGCWIGAGVVSAMFYGRIAERLGRAGTLRGSFSVVAVAALVLALTNVLAPAVAAIALLGVSMFVIYPANLSLVGNAVPARSRTAAYSLTSNIMIVGNSTFAYVSGRLADRFDIHAPFFLLAAASLLALGYLVVSTRRGRIDAPAGGETVS